MYDDDEVVEDLIDIAADDEFRKQANVLQGQPIGGGTTNSGTIGGQIQSQNSMKIGKKRIRLSDVIEEQKEGGVLI